jgi:hypothetical protein
MRTRVWVYKERISGAEINITSLNDTHLTFGSNTGGHTVLWYVLYDHSASTNGSNNDKTETRPVYQTFHVSSSFYKTYSLSVRYSTLGSLMLPMYTARFDVTNSVFCLHSVAVCSYNKQPLFRHAAVTRSLSAIFIFKEAIPLCAFNYFIISHRRYPTYNTLALLRLLTFGYIYLSN